MIGSPIDLDKAILRLLKEMNSLDSIEYFAVTAYEKYSEVLIWVTAEAALAAVICSNL